MTPSRIAAIAAIVVGVLALAFVGLRGGESERYTLLFDDASGLIPGNLVRVNGIDMGKVTDIGVSEDQRSAEIGIEITELGPLRRGTRAVVRATSLGGVANKYIALTLAPNNAPDLADGAVIGKGQTEGAVGQDEFVNAFDGKTRQGLKDLVKGQAETFDGSAEALRTAVRNAPGTLREAKNFAADLDPGNDSLRELLVNGAVITNALADRASTITRLTQNAGIAGNAAGGNGTEIRESLARAPRTIDEATATLQQLPETLADVRALIEKADSVKEGVPETLNELADTLNGGEDTIAALARSLNKDGDDNDLADLLKASVAVGDAAEKAGGSVPKGLSDATPLLAKARAYTPDIVSAVTGLGLISANYDGIGHYLRLSPVLNLFELSGATGNQDLVPRATFNNRLQGYQNTSNRCPGSAAQATSDGSAPFTDSGKISCNTSDVPPGP